MNNLKKTEEQIIKTIVKTTERMLLDRGYKPKTPSGKNGFYEFDTKDGKVQLLVNPTESLTSLNKVPNIQQFVSEDTNPKIWKRILVTKDCSLSCYLEIIKTKNEYSVEYFEAFRMMNPIVDHILLPEFKVLGSIDDKKNQQIMHDYMVTSQQIPRMKCTDPVARYLGVGSKTLLQIIRSSKTSGTAFSYRIIVSDPDPTEMFKWD